MNASRILTLLCCLSAALSTLAQVFDNSTRIRLDSLATTTIQARKARQQAPGHQSGARQTSYYPMVVSLTDIPGGMAELEEMGAVVFYTRGDMALACIPRDKAGNLEHTQFIDGASLGHARPYNDLARLGSHVDAAHSGHEATGGVPYTGRGVVAGICDIGFDPGHLAFRDNLGMMVVYNDTLATRTVYAPGSALANTDVCPDTDTRAETHGTHVANTLAGGRDSNPYYGAAPDATLCVVTSQCSDMALLCGIEDIIAYARERDMPAVINLSMGESMGPHDGTDLVNRYLDLLGEEAVICFSAGNTGESKSTLQHTFAGEDETFGSMFESSLTWNGFDIFGAIDLWSADSRPFEVRIIAYDLIDKKFVYSGPWTGSADGSKGEYKLKPGDDETFDRYFAKSGVAMCYGTDRRNGRYNAYFEFIINPTAELPGHHWARYVCGWQVRAAGGVHVDAYSDGVYTFMRNYSTPGQSDGNALMSISNLCCNRNTLSVGAWSTRNRYSLWDGTPVTYGFDTDAVASFSSYATLADGRRLPHFCCPGNYTLSAMSEPYAQQHPQAPYVLSETDGGRQHRWYGECGTSMASPMAAGIVALWLQACPDLTVTRVRELAQKTARRDFTDIDDARWGAGAMDALEGLRQLPSLSVSDISADGKDGAENVWYTLSGMRLPGRPTAPGLYISAPSRRLVRIR